MSCVPQSTCVSSSTRNGTAVTAFQRGDEVHTYPGDVTGRDAGGIIFSMIAGADERTCAREESRHVFYPVFGVPGQAPDALRSAQTRMAEYAALLAKDAQIACEWI